MMYPASKQSSKKADFTVVTSYGGLLRLATIMHYIRRNLKLMVIFI